LAELCVRGDAKVLYIEDDTGVLFGANGSALTALLIGISGVVPLAKVSIPAGVMWVYLLGIVFAFLSKAMIQLINDDTSQREKLQHMLDLLIAARNEPNITAELSSQIGVNWRSMDARYQTLFSPNRAACINRLRALFFFLSAFCFLISTARLVFFAEAFVKAG
jgi:hypothetical protein